MGWYDFRALLTEFERRGDVTVVEGADCHLEIGTLTELMPMIRGHGHGQCINSCLTRGTQGATFDS